MSATWAQRVSAEFLGSALLTLCVVGSGIAAQRLSPGNVGLQLLENALVTGVGLFTFIVMFAHISGSHFNPVVSLARLALGEGSWREVMFYLPAQVIGCVAGAVTANYLFAVPQELSTRVRQSGPHFVAEVIATAGLLMVIQLMHRGAHQHVIPAAVAAYITGAYFFTSSTSFANPAITVGRIFTNSFAGIAPGSAPSFVLAQLVGLVVGVVVIRFLTATRVAR
ncbi:MAG TPA: aquaporin [Acidimicrobiales bacterium]|jgi:arsenate reductase